MDYYGYAGNILHVDLSTRQIKRKSLDTNVARKFIGGPGIGLNMLLNILKPNTDPLSSNNVLVFGTGPLVGTLVPGSGKSYLSTKYSMPASRDGKKYFISASMFGSNRFGAMMKNAGYDHIVITGCADKPCYLKVTNEDVEICDAGNIWGKGVFEVGRILRGRHRGKTGNCGTWVIGRASENLVRFSLGWTDDWHNAGRFAGAVAGAKRLKAIVTLGNKGIRIADGKRFIKLVEDKRREITNHSNYQATAPLGKGRTGALLRESMVGIEGCSGGMCACKSIHEIKGGEHKGAWFGGSFLGWLPFIQRRLQLEDFTEALMLLGKANSYGLCVVTTVNMMRFVTQQYERGVSSRDDMGGLDLKVGSLTYYLALVDKIVHRQNIGATMAEGWYPLCERLGIDAATDYDTGCAITKGIDLLVDARIWPSLSKQGVGFSPCIGLGSIVHAKAKNTHSATYWASGEISFGDVKRDAEEMGVTKEELDRIFTEDYFDTGRLEKYGGDAETVYNLLGICDTSIHWERDPMRDMPWLSEVYSAVTGFDITPRDLLRAGERVLNLEKLLNIREGFNREDDRIPPVYLQNIETPLPACEGDRYLTDWFGRRLTKEDLETMLDTYYEERGWDIQKGVPTKAKLTELGLEPFADIVESI